MFNVNLLTPLNLKAFQPELPNETKHDIGVMSFENDNSIQAKHDIATMSLNKDDSLFKLDELKTKQVEKTNLIDELSNYQEKFGYFLIPLLISSIFGGEDSQRDSHLTDTGRDIVKDYTKLTDDPLGIKEDGLMPKDIKVIEEAYVKNKGANLSIKKNNNGTYTVTYTDSDGNHVFARYLQDGTLEKEYTDSDSGSTYICYDKNGNVIGVRTGYISDNTYYYEYYDDSTGCTTITTMDENGDYVCMVYDATGEMISMKITDGSSGEQIYP